MKAIIEFEFPRQFKENISTCNSIEDILKATLLGKISMKIINVIGDNVLTFDSLENSVCEYLLFDKYELQKKTRDRKIIEGRQILHYIAFKKHLGSLRDIGKRYGNKDHATVLSSYNRVNDLLEFDKEFKSKYKSFIESIINGTDIN